MDFRVFESIELDVHANSVAGGAFDGFIRAHFRRSVIQALDPDEDDMAVKARVVDESGAVVVAAFALTKTPGTNLVSWHGALAVPASEGVGHYILQVYQDKDLDLTAAQQAEVGSEDLDTSDMDPICFAFEYLA